MPDDMQRELGGILNELRNIRKDLDEIKASIRQDRSDIKELMTFKDLAYGCVRLLGIVLVALPVVVVFR